MKIVIDLTSLSYHMTGIERYAACISEQMLIQDKENMYILVFRNSIFPIFERFVDGERIKAVILTGDNKFLFLQWILPRSLKKIKADKYLFLAFTSPVLFRKKGIINTIHDMGAWDSADSMTFFQKMYWRTTYKVCAKVSEKIITVSNFSKGRISSILAYPENRIYVIYSAVYEGVTKDYGFKFDEVKKIYNLPDKYIMTLSTLEPRKNMELLLKAFSNIQDKVNYDLVLVGRKGWKMDEVLEQYNKSGRIHITGFVDDKHVSVIYKNAICFIFPSSYEGFGLPPVEALALGTPVISSNSASLPEILMESATYFCNESEEELRHLLINLNINLDNMVKSLTNDQKVLYRFSESARKILGLISEGDI